MTSTAAATPPPDGRLVLNFAAWAPPIGAALPGGLQAECTHGLVLVRGGEGRGKTHLLEQLAGVRSPQPRQVVLDGLDAASMPGAFQARCCLSDSQRNHWDQTPALDYWRGLQARHPDFDTDAADTLIEALGLEEHVAKPMYMLSTGSRRKVGLVGACASGARLTLLDQPLAALDTRSIRLLCDWLATQAESSPRLWLLADYEAPPALSVRQSIDLGD